MWHQADKNEMILRPLQGNGWKITDQAALEIDWDSEEHVESVRHRVALLTKGCNCKTGCRTARCGCVKRNGKCGAGCNCQNCCNLPTPTHYKRTTNMPKIPLLPVFADGNVEKIACVIKF